MVYAKHIIFVFVTNAYDELISSNLIKGYGTENLHYYVDVCTITLLVTDGHVEN